MWTRRGFAAGAILLPAACVTAPEPTPVETANVSILPLEAQAKRLGDLAAITPIRKISDKGLEFIAGHERFWDNRMNRDVALPYDDPKHCTIGYGYLIALGKCETVSAQHPQFPSYQKLAAGITKDEAVKLMRERLIDAEKAITKFLASAPQSIGIFTQQHKFDALCSLVYNIGAGTFRDSNVSKSLAAGDEVSAFGYWAKLIKSCSKDRTVCDVAPGLVRRRAEEMRMYNGGIDPVIPGGASFGDPVNIWPDWADAL